MKIRITSGSIRFRLKQPEVMKFQQAGSLDEIISFGAGEFDQLTFSLKKSDDVEIKIEKGINRVGVRIPLKLAEEWTSTERVGLEASVETHEGYRIFVLVEKDFACLDGSDLENEGTYPNPLANCQIMESDQG